MLRAAFLACAVLLCQGLAQAEDPTPAWRAGLPPPSDAAAFEFTGYVLRAGAPYGRVMLAARVGSEGQWIVTDAIRPVRPGDDRVEAHGELDRTLAITSLRYARTNAGGYLRASVTPHADEGYRIEHETGEYHNQLDVGGRAATGSLAAVLLMLRLLPPGPGVYELPDLDPNPAPGDPYVATARIQVHRKAPWGVGGEEREAWIVSYARGTQTLRLALATSDRSLLGVEFIGLPFQFVPTGSGPVGLVGSVARDLMTPIEAAVARTRALRAALPAPAAGFEFRGHVRLGDTQVGEVLLRARPASHRGQPAWSVVESQVLRTGTSVVEAETSGLLHADLSVLRGERVDKRPSGSWIASYGRVDGGMRVVSSLDGRVGDPVVLAAAADASAGLIPVLLLLQQVPLEPQHYLLPGFDPRFAGTPKAGSGSFAFHAADTHVEVLAAGQLTLDGVTTPSLHARCTLRDGRRYDVHLDPDRRSVLAVVGRMPTTLLVPATAEAKKPDWYDAVEGAPATARQAFVKFGRGYHLPREDLVQAAFHWPTMLKAAIAKGQYPEGTALEQVRADWVDVFVSMSKHRTTGDCDDLLFQILMTSRETQNADGSVTLHTLPVYGGHAYRMAELDGRWWIVAVD